MGHLPRHSGICPKKGENDPVLSSVVLEEVVPVCDSQGLEPAVDPEFRQDPLGVVPGGRGADVEPRCDPLGALAVRDQPENVSLPGG